MKMVNMSVNTIEKDFLEQIRAARAGDVRTVVEYLHKLKDKEDKRGKGLTPVGLLTAVICEELILNGMVKFRNIEECEGGKAWEP